MTSPSDGSELEADPDEEEVVEPVIDGGRRLSRNP